MSDRPDLRVVGEVDDILAEGRDILARQSASSWEFADWAARPELADRPIREIAEAVGISRGKFGEYRTVSMTWPVSTRMDTLTFTHHRALCRAPAEARHGLLQAAADDGWSVAETQTKAREASLEGQLSRQAAEIRALKKALAAAKADPRDVVAGTKDRLAAAARVCRQEAARGAALVEETITDDLVAGLHGNARRGLARDLRRLSDTLAAGVNVALDRIGAIADRVDGGGTA